MPIYEYECNACGHRLEAMQQMSDDPLKDCPECHKPELKKLISASAFRLKGGGWYETDFKSKNQKNLSQSEGKSQSSSNSSDSSSGSSNNDSKATANAS